MSEATTITLAGRATGLDARALEHLLCHRFVETCSCGRPAVRWQILVWDYCSRTHSAINLETHSLDVAQQLIRVSESCPIRVIARLPLSLPPSSKLVAMGSHDSGQVLTFDVRLDAADMCLDVLNVEILSWPATAAAAAAMEKCMGPNV
jgi:hypothetical protein